MLFQLEYIWIGQRFPLLIPEVRIQRIEEQTDQVTVRYEYG